MSAPDHARLLLLQRFCLRRRGRPHTRFTSQRVRFSASGHRGSAFKNGFSYGCCYKRRALVISRREEGCLIQGEGAEARTTIMPRSDGARET